MKKMTAGERMIAGARQALAFARKLGPGLYFGNTSLPVLLSIKNQYSFFRYLEILAASQSGLRPA